MPLRELFVFPDPVNEYAARCTAALVVALAIATILAPAPAFLWLLGALTIGFALRVAGGPRYSPFGRLSVHVLAPRVAPEPKLTSGPPKRFAQLIGLVLSAVALGVALADLGAVAKVLLGVLVAAAGAEAAFGVCLGCWIYGRLQRAGVISDESCAECADIWSRPEMAARS